MDKIRSLQILRFVAAATVVHCHVLRYSGGAAIGYGLLGEGLLRNIGAAGVDVFFVISGLVIALTGPLATPRPSAAAFFWRRWSRVAPIYYLVSAVMMTLLAIGMVLKPGGPASLNWDQTVATFLFWPDFGPSPVVPYLMPGWTLSFEMVFYAAVSLILVGGRLSRNLLIGAGVVGVTLVARALGWGPAHFLTSPIFSDFGCGVCLAWAWPMLRRISPWAGAGLIVAGLIVLIVGARWGGADIWQVQSIIYDTHALRRVIAIGPAAVLLVAGALVCEPWVKAAVWAPLVRLGDASYAIYLVHVPVMMVVGAAMLGAPAGLPVDVKTVGGIAVCILAGWLVHRLVEKPILRDVRALGRRVSGAVPRPAMVPRPS